jgi:hypothetical protein
MNMTNQGACQSRKTAKNGFMRGAVGAISQPRVGAKYHVRLGTFAMRPALKRQHSDGVATMIGKLLGAWIGDKVAGEHEGAKGAILGYGAAALAKRSVPTLAALALGGWAFKKWRDKRRAEPTYPSEASPS